jgi:hypothetical protein
MYAQNHNGTLPDTAHLETAVKPYLLKPGEHDLKDTLHCPRSNAPGLSYAMPDNLKGARLIYKKESDGINHDYVVFADGRVMPGEQVVLIYEVDPKTGKPAALRHGNGWNYFGLGGGVVLPGESLDDPKLRTVRLGPAR